MTRLKFHRARAFTISTHSPWSPTTVASARPLGRKADPRLCRRVYTRRDRTRIRACHRDGPRRGIGWAKYEKDTRRGIDWNIGRKVGSRAIASRPRVNSITAQGSLLSRSSRSSRSFLSPSASFLSSSLSCFESIPVLGRHETPTQMFTRR